MGLSGHAAGRRGGAASGAGCSGSPAAAPGCRPYPGQHLPPAPAAAASHPHPNRTCFGASTSGRTHRPTRCLQVFRTACEHNTQHSSPLLPLGPQGIDIDGLIASPELPTPRQLVNRQIKSCLSLKQLTTLIVHDVAGFDSVNTSHALWRLAKMHRDHLNGLSGLGRQELGSQRKAYTELVLPAVDALTVRLHQVVGNFEPWDTTLALRAYAQLRHVDEATINVLCASALEGSPLFKPIDCANVMVALAQLGYRPTELLKNIVQCMLDTLDECQPVELANVTWGFARLQCHPGPAYLTAVTDKVRWQAQHFSSEELCNTLWSFVRLNHEPDKRVLADVEVVLVQRLRYLVPQQMALACWAFPRLKYKALHLLDELPQYAVVQLQNFKNAELCGLLSGYGFARHYHRVLLDAVAEAVQYRLDTLSGQELCIMVWAYGVFRHRPSHPDFGRRLATALHTRMPEFSAQGLSMIAKALWQLQWRSDSLLKRLTAAAEQRMQDFKPLELSQLLWGLSHLQCTDLAIFHLVVHRSIVLLQTPQGPYHSQMLNHKVVNSIVCSCERMGFMPWTLLDFAESKGVRVRQPSKSATASLGSIDDDDDEEESSRYAGVEGEGEQEAAQPGPLSAAVANGVPQASGRGAAAAQEAASSSSSSSRGAATPGGGDGPGPGTRGRGGEWLQAREAPKPLGSVPAPAPPDRASANGDGGGGGLLEGPGSGPGQGQQQLRWQEEEQGLGGDGDIGVGAAAAAYRPQEAPQRDANGNGNGRAPPQPLLLLPEQYQQQSLAQQVASGVEAQMGQTNHERPGTRGQLQQEQPDDGPSASLLSSSLILRRGLARPAPMPLPDVS